MASVRWTIIIYQLGYYYFSPFSTLQLQHYSARLDSFLSWILHSSSSAWVGSSSHITLFFKVLSLAPNSLLWTTACFSHSSEVSVAAVAKKIVVLISPNESETRWKAFYWPVSVFCWMTNCDHFCPSSFSITLLFSLKSHQFGQRWMS